MINSYRSDHPNHVHQLTVAVSKHYYASKDGALKYQKKPMEISLSETHASARRHMVIYSLRDHCSGVFYSEIAFCPSVPTAQDFLGRAWGRKADYLFHGLPVLLTIPRTVQAVFPSLASDAEMLGIKLVDVTSGFQGGIRDLRTIEDSLVLSINKPIAEAQDWVNYICVSHAKDASRVHGKTKIELWQQGVPAIRLPAVGWGSEA
jgi:hypothetical protein